MCDIVHSRPNPHIFDFDLFSFSVNIKIFSYSLDLVPRLTSPTISLLNQYLQIPWSFFSTIDLFTSCTTILFLQNPLPENAITQTFDTSYPDKPQIMIRGHTSYNFNPLIVRSSSKPWASIPFFGL